MARGTLVRPGPTEGDDRGGAMEREKKRERELGRLSCGMLRSTARSRRCASSVPYPAVLIIN